MLSLGVELRGKAFAPLPRLKAPARRSGGRRALADRAGAEVAGAALRLLARQGAATGRQAGVSGGPG